MGAGLALGSALAAACLQTPDDGERVWMWSGGVTASSAVVKARVPGRTEFRLVVSPNEDLSFGSVHPFHFDREQDDGGIATFHLSGLVPGTLYHYALDLATEEDGPPELELQGRFRTFARGAQSFRIVFGSCAATGSNHRIFETIRGIEPLFFLHMGDLHYENIERNDSAAFRAAFDQVLASPRQSELYRSAPIVYIWDDHDFGINNSDGTSPTKPAALTAYRQAVPHYPLVEDPEGSVSSLFQAFSVGRVRFVVTDPRSGRTPEAQSDGPEKTMLGEQQRDRLLRELEKSREQYPLIVWVNPVPWITRRTPDSQSGWAPYAHERRLIADRVRSLGLDRRILMLSGDGHMVAIDDGTNSNYASRRMPGERSFPVVHAAPLDRYAQLKGGPYSHGFHLGSRLGFLASQQFGLMEVEDDGATVTVKLSGRDSHGELLSGMRLVLTCTTSGCDPSS